MEIIFCTLDSRLLECFQNEINLRKTQYITAKQGDIIQITLEQNADAIVSPANSFGDMGGGVDLRYREYFGWQLEERLQKAIAQKPFGELLVGDALVINTGHNTIKNLVCAPTMRFPHVLPDPEPGYLASRVATYAALCHKVEKLVMPGMGTGVGALPGFLAARYMLAGIADAFSFFGQNKA